MLLLGPDLLVLGLMLLGITLPAFRRAAPARPRPEQKLRKERENDGVGDCDCIHRATSIPSGYVQMF
jgi:hypothetical protein